MDDYIHTEITADFIRKAFSECEHIMFYDLETTGLDPHECRIIEFSAVKFDICKPASVSEPVVLKESNKVTVYIKPEEMLSDDIVSITGYTDDFLADKPCEDEAFEVIRNFIPENCVVAGYNNNSFDNNFMESLYVRHGENFRYAYTFDVMRMAKQLHTKDEVGSFKLSNIAHYLGVDDGITFHKASDDTEATIRVFGALIPRLKEDKAEYILVKPFVNSVYYTDFADREHITVNTVIGLIHYDIAGKRWKSPSINLSGVDLDYITEQCCEAVGASNIGELAKFRGEKILI